MEVWVCVGVSYYSFLDRPPAEGAVGFGVAPAAVGIGGGSGGLEGGVAAAPEVGVGWVGGEAEVDADGEDGADGVERAAEAGAHPVVPEGGVDGDLGGGVEEGEDGELAALEEEGEDPRAEAQGAAEG